MRCAAFLRASAATSHAATAHARCARSFCPAPLGRSLRAVSSTAPASDMPGSSTPAREDGTEQERYLKEKFLKRGLRKGWARSSFFGSQAGGNIHDEYELQESLGLGGMGQVRAARHKKTDKVVAVKVVDKTKVDDVDALRREFNFLKVIDHPNVVRLYETFEDEEHLYVVMERCVGDNLLDTIENRLKEGGEFDEAEIVQMAEQMLRALAYCHNHSIVHRDIKPANFIRSSTLTCSSSLKLVDFGVSGVVPKQKSSEPDLSSVFPSSSSSNKKCDDKFLTVRTGTAGYIAPEILQTRPYGAPADMFSLGATVFTMITGKSPKWLEAVGFYHFPDNHKLQRLSPEGRRFMARLLAREPKARPSAEEALKDPWLQKAKDASKGARSTDDKALSERLRKFGKRSKLQQCARAAVAALADLDDGHHDVEELRDAFIAADQKGDGEIHTAALADILKMEEQAEAEALLASIDTDRTGTIAFSEWLAAASPSSFFDSDSEAFQAFKLLDRDGDGQISAKDLEAVLPQVFSHGEFDEEKRKHDLDGGGQIDFKEFKKVLRRSMDAFKTSTAPPTRKGSDCAE